MRYTNNYTGSRCYTKNKDDLIKINIFTYYEIYCIISKHIPFYKILWINVTLLSILKTNKAFVFALVFQVIFNN